MFELTALSEKISTDDGMKHSILQSLLNWSEAKPNDLIDADQDRQGWWADEFLSGVGTRDWTLARAKQTPETLSRAKIYTQKALQWLIDQNHAVAIDVQTSYNGERLSRLITVTRPNRKTFEMTL